MLMGAMGLGAPQEFSIFLLMKASNSDFSYQWTSVPTTGIKAEIDYFFDFAVRDQPSTQGGRANKGTKEGAGSEELHTGGVPRVSATIFGSFGKEPTTPPAL